MLDLVGGLRTPFALEKSVRLCHQALLPNRYLITLAKSALGPKGDERVLGVSRELGISPTLVPEVERYLPMASAVHWGYEQSLKSSLYKLYIEFRAVDEAIRSLDAADPIPQHLAFKWDASNPERYVVSRYLWHPGITYPALDARFDEIYASPEHVEAREISRWIIRLASHRIPSEDLHYLEVAEVGNARRSFDLNLYDGDLRVSDLFPALKRMCQQYAIPPEPFMNLYEQIEGHVLGHVAGGIHRKGETFFNVYFSAEPKPRAARPDFTARSSGTPLPRVTSVVSQPTPLAAAKRVFEPPVEMTTPADRYFNYCLWPYEPVSATADKYRPVNLLLDSFALAGIGPRSLELVDALRAGIGAFQTVWGVKWLGDRLAWEFYFYDYKRLDREVSVTRVLEALRPFSRWPAAIDEHVPYFMFSIDIDAELINGGHTLDVIHLYLGNPGSTVSSGIAYALTPEGRRLENLYYFFQAPRDLEAAANKIACSAFVDVSRIKLDRILWPELRTCHTICVANKQRNDTVYFSGVNVNQMLFFMERLSYPPEIVRYVREHRSKLDHLLFDVGFDYVARGDELIVLKSGYYGVF